MYYKTDLSTEKLAVAPIVDDVANVTVVEGQNATFTCKILMSDSQPFLQWLKHYDINGSFTNSEGNPHINILQVRLIEIFLFLIVDECGLIVKVLNQGSEDTSRISVHCMTFVLGILLSEAVSILV